MNIFVGNLAKEVTQEDLQEVFGAFGEVSSAAVIKDKFTGEPRGFAFVEMPAKAQAQAAIDGVKEIKGKMVTVNEARPKESGNRGGGRSGGFGRRQSGGGNRDRRGGGGGGWR